MVTTTPAPGPTSVPPVQPVRDEQALADRYYDLLALNPDALEAELAQIATIEHSLPEPLRYGEVRARLLAWLALSAEDRRILVRSFQRALATLPDEVSEARVDAERAVILNSLTFEEFTALADDLDWCEQELPSLVA